jgi:hypothetical protein
MKSLNISNFFFFFSDSGIDPSHHRQVPRTQNDHFLPTEEWLTRLSPTKENLFDLIPMNYRLPKDSSNNEYSMIPFQRRFSDFQNQFEDFEQLRGHNYQGNKFQYPSHHRMQARNFQFLNQFPIQSLNNFYNIYKRNLDSNTGYKTFKPNSQNHFPNIQERNSNIGYEMPNSNSFNYYNNKKQFNSNYNPEDIIEEPGSQDLKPKTKSVEITITIDSPSQRRVEVKTENIQTERQTDKKEDSEAIGHGNVLSLTFIFKNILLLKFQFNFLEHLVFSV